MTRAEANVLFEELGALLRSGGKWHEIESYGPHLSFASRNEVRRATMLFLADFRFNGHDPLLRRPGPDGKLIALQELLDGIWPLISLFRVRFGEVDAHESEDERDRAARLADDFHGFLYALKTDDPEYWDKVYAKLNHF